MVFTFHLTKSFWSWTQKLLDVAAGAEAKKHFRCLELEPDPEHEI